MFQVAELVWDNWNEDHIAKHGVSRHEVEEVVWNQPFPTRARVGTYRLIGQSDDGRLLTVFIAPRGKGSFYVVTSRDAEPDERRAYRQH